MKKRGDALALAVALSAGEEVTLGPSDTAMCAEALQFYANARMRSRVLKIMRLPAMIAAAMIGLMAGGSLTTVVSRASSKVSGVPVHQFEEAVRRHVKPIAHTSSHFAAAYAPTDG